jgi:hypothetical protein
MRCSFAQERDSWARWPIALRLHRRLATLCDAALSQTIENVELRS